MSKSLDENFLDSLLRGEAIVLASRIHDKQRIAQQLRERIEQERQNLFMQETVDEHLRQEYGPGVIRLDLVKIPMQFEFSSWNNFMRQRIFDHAGGAFGIEFPKDA